MPVVLRQKRLSAKKQTAFLFSITNILFLGRFCVQYFVKLETLVKLMSLCVAVRTSLISLASKFAL